MGKLKGRSKLSYAHRNVRATLEPYRPEEEAKPVVPPCVVRALVALARSQCDWRSPGPAVRMLRRLGHLEAAAWIEANPRAWLKTVYVGPDLKASLRGS